MLINVFSFKIKITLVLRNLQNSHFNFRLNFN